MRKCPTCAREPLPREKNPAFPFCSARCKMVDLGRWLSEEYRVPGEPQTRDVDEEVS